MATLQKFDIIDSGARDAPVRLRPADGYGPKTTKQIAGLFEIAAQQRSGPTMRDVLMTGLLVIYPVFAALAAILAGFFLAGAGGA
ncbi:hypothetical protein NKJ36_03200 [Mesorhizobium sp. M0142]|uniref:hypothetical protein n=1 Tax=unclassified Mesorhizobium TaxID=325217 RepID=UPI00333DB3D7